MNTIWHDLLVDMAVLALLVSVWSNAHLLQRVQDVTARQMGFGLLLATGGIVVMMLPFRVGDGIFVDLRSTVVAVSGFFGGPISLAVTTLAVAAFRVHLGGAGMVIGLIGIAAAAAIGLVAHQLRRKGPPSARGILAFSGAVAISSIVGSLALPTSIVIPMIETVLVPTMVIVLIATLMVSLAITSELRRRETARNNHVYKMVIDSLSDCLNVKDTEGRFIIANPATAALMKAPSPDAVIGKSDFDFYPEEIAQRFRAEEQDAARGMSAYVIEQKVVHRDGTSAWLSTLKSPLLDENGAVIGLVTHNRDVTAKKELETALAESERKATAALTHMADGIVMFDENLQVVFCNEQYRRMFPITADLRVPGTPAAAILHASIARGELVNIPAESANDWVNSAVSRLRRPGTVQFPLFDGRWIESRTNPTPDGTCFVVCSDITNGKQSEQALRDLNVRLAELAETDGLTGLLNRRAFDRFLAHEIEATDGGKGELSLLLIDVDRFKAFNDTYGHTAGDDCLRRIAEALRSVAHRPGDHVARYGGEEMALILPDTPEDGAVALAQKLRQRVRALQVAHAGSEKSIVTISVGVATFTPPSPGGDAGRLVQRADEALYAAKASGRDSVRAWTPPRPELVKSRA